MTEREKGFRGEAKGGEGGRRGEGGERLRGRGLTEREKGFRGIRGGGKNRWKARQEEAKGVGGYEKGKGFKFI